MRLVLWAAQSLNPSRMRVWKGIWLGFETPLFFGEAQLRIAAAGAFQRIGGVHVEHKGPVGQRPPMATSLSERSFSMSRPRP